MRDGVLDGLRVDHPDGLADPAGYLRRLREAGAEHVWVEKILDPGEALRDWPVDGTVGYEFLNDVGGAVRRPGRRGARSPRCARRSRATRARSRRSRSRPSSSRRRRRSRARSTRLRAPGRRARRSPRRWRALPVYRTYVEPWCGRVADDDREAIAAAGHDAGAARVLLLEDARPEEFVTRFQQTSPPVTAKGVEDTAFYRYARLLALNEVGGDPARFGVSVADFHAANAERARRFPRNLLVTQTHDTKRSGDVRARHRRAGGDGRRVGRERCALARAQRAAAARRARPTPTRST